MHSDTLPTQIELLHRRWQEGVRVPPGTNESRTPDFSVLLRRAPGGDTRFQEHYASPPAWKSSVYGLLTFSSCWLILKKPAAYPWQLCFQYPVFHNITEAWKAMLWNSIRLVHAQIYTKYCYIVNPEFPQSVPPPGECRKNKGNWDKITIPPTHIITQPPLTHKISLTLTDKKRINAHDSCRKTKKYLTL